MDVSTWCPKIELASVRKLLRRRCGSACTNARVCVCVCVYGCVVSSLDIHLDFSYIYIADLFTKKM